MFQDKPEWIAHQRQLWLRSDAKRWLRPDAQRWMTPEERKWLLPERKQAVAQPHPEPVDLAALERAREHLLRLRSELLSLRAELKFRRFLWSLKAGFNPHQPRVPAGNPNGGQWTSERGSGDVGSAVNFGAGGSEGTSSDSISSDVHRVASKVTIDYSEALTGISNIDDTTKDLVDTLAIVVAILPQGSGPLYGTAVHTAFANAVRAQRLAGIGYFDVETTFSLRDGARYGSEGSIRTDIVLRNEAGQIIAIYDVKTGRRGISEARAAELRAKTGTGPEVPIIELNVRRQRVFLKGHRAMAHRFRWTISGEVS
jgi:hypothetical protein